MISSVHLRLRDGTRDRHEALDQGLALTGGDIDHTAYLNYLRALLGWLEPLERQLWQLDWPDSLQAAARAGKSDWIRADLAAAGDATPVPHCADAPRIEAADAYALGVAYVVEGSQLGGRFLAKHLAEVAPELPLRYLRGYGEQLGPMWKTFLQFLDSEAGAQGREDHALQGACDAFDSLTAWLRSRHALRT
ncbi:biliverdin-producing heme oxygenase [Achromobacter sp. MY14]|uniref:biliverdin-producing heme oxygenase n=1 Tax=unclassified Achromobacter TaxID=2626865 RepID=UPI001E65B056|nr:biliverdin-producing heme oxygenase [Achromobacter sp. MY14]MCD0498115.1 biliverdin-producing heme oxygenase [Achromobacter sp. MY14]